MSNQDSKKNLEIESLRGIAVLLTVLCHVPVMVPFHGPFFMAVFSLWTPWTGVDLFFCISGYVVSKAYLEVFDNYRQRGLYWLAAQTFFIRRAYRLLPSAWLWVLIGLVCAIFFNRTGVFASWQDNMRSAAVILTFSGNIANQYGLLLNPNHVYWSLALEEQFYMLFPVFLFFVVTTRWRVQLLLLMIAIQFFINRNPFGTPFQGMASSLRLDAIMWGVLIYFFSRSQLYRNFEPVFLRGSKLASYAVVCLLLYMLVAIPAQMILLPAAVGLIAMVTALLVFLASFNSNYIVRVPVLTPILIWVGARSYGIYLIHVFVYRFVYEGWTRYAAHFGLTLDASYTWPMAATAAVLMIALAEFNYRCVEIPLRDKGTKLAKQRLQEYGAQ
jgi:peptidoglycan/LPS O-acetylase OafA/YrhL